jgi:hypothetical protein
MLLCVLRCDAVLLTESHALLCFYTGGLQFYDTDKLFPVVGFGGAPFPSAPVSHCFPMTDDGSGGPCHGIAGVMQAYSNTLRTVALSGPTLFTQIIQQAAAIAASSGVHQGNQKYFVLLIITDGAYGVIATAHACSSW